MSNTGGTAFQKIKNAIKRIISLDFLNIAISFAGMDTNAKKLSPVSVHRCRQHILIEDRSAREDSLPSWSGQQEEKKFCSLILGQVCKGLISKCVWFFLFASSERKKNIPYTFAFACKREQISTTISRLRPYHQSSKTASTKKTLTTQNKMKT